MRLRPALIREDQARNELNYRRLQFFDSTLERIIQRFEDEYPETKVEPLPSPPDRKNQFEFSPPPGASYMGSSPPGPSLDRVLSSEEVIDAEADDTDLHGLHLARNGSNASLAARAQMLEEGQMHRFGQEFRRKIMKPTGTLDYEHGTTTEDEPEPAHIAQLRERLERYTGEELKREVEKHGVDNVITELGFSMQELSMLEKSDPEGYEKFRQAQMAAELNTRQAAISTNGTQPSIYADT